MTTLGKYELLDKIGEGGYGIVYKARDPLLEREVAIKVLRADIASAPDFIERFRREARLAASLRHPNIVGVIEVGEQDGRYYLVMEYLDGEVLSARLKAGQPLPLSQAVEILRPLAEALDYAHGRGLVHRDVKPSNIILADGGKRPVLTDFGLVKSMSESGLTTTGKFLGTVEYMAPERILGQEVGPAVDQYSLGVIAFQMLTGQVPFGGNPPFAIQKGHTEQAPPDPRTLNPFLPDRITDILCKVLAKSPSERYENCSEFVNELQSIVTSVNENGILEALNASQQLIENYQYDRALDKLNEIGSVRADARIFTLQQECNRRKEVWERLQTLRSQEKQISSEINTLTSQDEWLLMAEKVSDQIQTEATSLEPHRANDSDDMWVWLIVIIFAGILIIAVLIILGFSGYL